MNQLVRVYIAQKRKILQGDKMAGRHGNKGVIAKILPVEDMPYLPSGRPVQIILNPLGVPSRMNIGQILETHLGGAAHTLGLNCECPVFDGGSETDVREYMRVARLKRVLEMNGLVFNSDEMMRLHHDVPVIDRLKGFMKENNVIMTSREGEAILEQPEDRQVELVKKELRKTSATATDDEIRTILHAPTLEDRLRELLREKHLERSDEQITQVVDLIEKWKQMPEDGKTVLFDGRTGDPFDCRITVGQIYMLKLAHLVDDKIHARSTGPYSLITQQPLGGKAQFGGQRFGEMEVWALEAYGAAYTLQELLTVKSDDVVGRVKTYEAIVKGENVMEPGVPESFKVLIKELQSLCLDVKILSGDEMGRLKEIELKGVEDQQDIKATAKELGLEFGEEAALLS